MDIESATIVNCERIGKYYIQTRLQMVPLSLLKIGRYFLLIVNCHRYLLPNVNLISSWNCDFYFFFLAGPKFRPLDLVRAVWLLSLGTICFSAHLKTLKLTLQERTHLKINHLIVMTLVWDGKMLICHGTLCLNRNCIQGLVLPRVFKTSAVFPNFLQYSVFQNNVSPSSDRKGNFTSRSLKKKCVSERLKMSSSIAIPSCIEVGPSCIIK